MLLHSSTSSANPSKIRESSSAIPPYFLLIFNASPTSKLLEDLLRLLARAQALEPDAVVVRQRAADASGVHLQSGSDAASDDHPESRDVSGIAAELAEHGVLDHGAAGVPDVAGDGEDDIVEDGVRNRRLDFRLDRLAVRFVHALLRQHHDQLLPARDDGRDRGQQAQREQVVRGAREVRRRLRRRQRRGELRQRRRVDVKAEGERQEGQREVYGRWVDGLAGVGC
nr:hypothetical protein CFP56_70569 [Quercus suber]POF07668.1 hypothetical protein CFP56_70570 [Quercus suber]